MSTIFGHGRLRLYLLKLLDESPRHGYEIISLLRDRFLGVYSPSPGTIYPRLARLEEEGLVTHTEEGGRKVYRLTDKGREELHERSGDLEDLEREITDSVRDVARAVKQDVRATISSLRDELKFAAGGPRRDDEHAGDRTAGGKEEQSGSSEQRNREDDGQSRDRDRDDEQSSSPWAREWERFAKGFGAFGAVWTRGRSDQQEHPDFEQTLRDFSDRVRDVVREAGQVGESATGDLRRILDDTIEVIRRDMRHWGPAPSGDTEEQRRDEPGEPGSHGPEDSGTAATGAEESRPRSSAESAKDKDTGTDGHRARPMPPAGDRPGDPWSTAVDDTESDTGDSGGNT